LIFNRVASWFLVSRSQNNVRAACYVYWVQT
jgi:hypothetical protein